MGQAKPSASGIPAGRPCALGRLHPAVALGFFAAAIAMTILVQGPLFSAVALGAAAALYRSLRGRGAWRLIAAMAPLMALLTLVNPLFNTAGDTVLLTWLGRPYTLEALAAGLQTAAMFAAVLLWFASFNRVLTADRLTYLFGGAAPALSLVLTMTLRLVPTYQRKAAQIATARAGVGKAPRGNGLRAGLRHGTQLLSALGTWATEGAVTTADSMASRGYGCGPRTRYGRYPMGRGEGAVAVALVVLGTAALAAILAGGASAQFFPQVALAPLTPLRALGLVALAGFLGLPTLLDAWEEVAWRCSTSRI